ncbi:hypothetical protein ATE66_09550 [Sphingopyxis sp. H107]|nr:hypothetical protein ATE61_05550 [Sphingopyxis sp. H057]KTE54712.1 hypothetical protein ATE64_05545 [Sphingopyxis sp. H073]KTE60115.1 hypothetical protein ATE66_09550 [Sphingopyxis sp. H107]KTE67598.1 hypothetical protein ATE60_19205 [Sphingopyxis sp. H081]KTE67845.1 hypothetical protein ATE65_00050 [Sphingopyxis sp. H100]KTE82228.1 hypothetical protein ATE63_05165 [Sphingopyxis sp. H067]
MVTQLLRLLLLPPLLTPKMMQLMLQPQLVHLLLHQAQMLLLRSGQQPHCSRMILETMENTSQVTSTVNFLPI